MKKNIIYLTVIALLILVFKNYDVVLSSTIGAVDIWLYKVFPYLFIMIIINDILISVNFSHFFKNPSTYIFIMSLLSGTPSSAYITSELVNKNVISKEYGNTTLMFTYFANPLFLYTILSTIFNSSFIAVKLMIIHYLSNLIIYIFQKKRLKPISFSLNASNLNLSKSIRSSITTNMMVLGAITFYLVISNIILHTFNLPLGTEAIVRGLLEVTQGLNMLTQYSFNYKEMLAILFISFGGFSIHTQVKCILDEANLNYTYFLKGRILQTIIALILTCIS